MNNKEHQGKYHLLAILLIPGFLVSIFLSSHWLIPTIFGAISAGIIYWAFKSR